MSRRCTPLFAALTCAALPAAAQEAAPAEPQTEPVRVSYAAPAGCPVEGAFIERVRSRVQRARFAEPDELARAFDVTVRNTPGEAGFVGHLEFVGGDAQHAERTVRGATCDELASSLALITALAIDDRAEPAEPAGMPPLPSPPPLAPSTPPEAAKPSWAASPREPEPAAPRARERLRWDVGLSAGTLTWITSDAALSFGAYFELGAPKSGWSARLSNFYSRQTRVVTNVGSADFATDWARLEGCPFTLPFSSQLSLTPCAALDLGVLHASAVQSTTLVPQPSKNRWWAAAVALLRLGWQASPRWVLGVDGEFGVPFVSDTFQFRNPTVDLFKTPQIGGGGKFWVGLRFP